MRKTYEVTINLILTMVVDAETENLAEATTRFIIKETLKPEDMIFEEVKAREIPHEEQIRLTNRKERGIAEKRKERLCK